MTNDYPNLKIYVDRKLIRYFPDELDKNIKYTISFYVSLDDINSSIGEKIEEVLNDISNRLSNFTILPVPICLFKSDYPKSLSKKMIDRSKKFLMDGNEFRFFSDEEIKDLRGRLKLFHKCSECKFKRNGLCEGIYGVKVDKVRSEKTNQWLISDIQKHGRIRLLDLGCGDTPFLGNYVDLSRQNKSLFFCVDPSDIYTKNLKEKIPEDIRSNIIPLIGIGEYIPLSDDIFDFVLLQYSYSHFIDIEKTMKNIYRVLKKGGVLLIFEAYFPEESVKSEVKTEKKSWKDILLDQVEFRNHDIQDAAKILERHGFEILDSFESGDKKRISWGIKSKKV